MPSTASNQPRDLQPTQLLRYLPAYEVVVCASCRYAIQPNAIPRHLKEIHHINRSRRRPFIEYAANLPLKDPQNVSLPKAHEFPVPDLPVEQGFKCESRDCPYLCASVKRMKSHWASEHGRPAEPSVDWRPVPLQTFFRGNLLRYFTRVPDGNDNTGFGLEKREVGWNRSGCHLLPPEPPRYNEDMLDGYLEFERKKLPDPIDDTLFQHYIEYTCVTIATNAETERIWKVIVPELAYEHPFLMHGILACSAQHLAYLNPAQKLELTIRACSNQDKGMPLFRFAIENPRKENCHAILAFSHLPVIYSFASDRQQDSMLLVDNDGVDILPSWLHFLRGGCSMLCTVWDDIKAGPVQALAAAWDEPMRIEEDLRTPLLESLLSLFDERTCGDAWPEEVRKVYHDAAIELGRAFSCMEALKESCTTWDVLRIWPLELSIDYMALLRKRCPGALILLAHYCVILNKMQSNWYCEGQASRLMSTILSHLDGRWHCCIQGPLKINNRG